MRKKYCKLKITFSFSSYRSPSMDDACKQIQNQKIKLLLSNCKLTCSATVAERLLPPNHAKSVVFASPGVLPFLLDVHSVPFPCPAEHAHPMRCPNRAADDGQLDDW